MELRKGFKQTEVGVIPEEWEAMTIRDLVERGILEKPLDGNHGNIHPKSSDFVDIGIPFVMANDVTDGRIDFESCHYIRKEQADRLQKGFAVSRDVLLTHKGSVGRTAIVGSLTTDYIMLTPQVTYYRVRDSTRLSNGFLHQYFKSDGFQGVLAARAGGGTRAYLGIIGQQDLPVVLPPELTEQTAIATALANVDSLIQNLEQLIEKEKQIKLGAMQELLTPKTEWLQTSLGELAEVVMGQSPPSTFYNTKGHGLPLIQGNADIDNRKTIRRFYTSSVTKRGRTGDIILSVRAPVGEVAHSTFDCCLGRGVAAIRYKNNFLYHYLVFVETGWSQLSTGSTFDSINGAQLRGLKLSLPRSSEAQVEIAGILDDIDASISALEVKLNKWKRLKQAMMQVLLTGQIRLI
jgi:type I restriction enzyme, S subunit